MPTCFLCGLWNPLEAKSLLHLGCWRTKPLPPAFSSQCHLKHARILPWAWHSLQNATALQQKSTRTLHFMREKSSCSHNKAMPLLGWGSKYTYLEFPHTWCSPKMCLLRARSHASNMLPLSFPYAVICFKKLYKLSVKSFLYISFGLFQLIYWINLESQKENSLASDPVIQQAARSRTNYWYIPNLPVNYRIICNSIRLQECGLLWFNFLPFCSSSSFAFWHDFNS